MSEKTRIRRCEGESYGDLLDRCQAKTIPNITMVYGNGFERDVHVYSVNNQGLSVLEIPTIQGVENIKRLVSLNEEGQDILDQIYLDLQKVFSVEYSTSLETYPLNESLEGFSGLRLREEIQKRKNMIKTTLYIGKNLRDQAIDSAENVARLEFKKDQVA